MEALQRLHNRGSISTGYEIDNSCKFEPDNSESMSRTPSGNGNLKTCTLSFWVKITELNKSHMFFTGDYGGAANPWFVIGLISDKIYISSTAGVSGASVVPSRLFRDTSAWYHLVFAFDTTQGTAADRIKIYVNGVQETVFTSTTYPSLNEDLDIMAAKAQGIAGYNDGTDYRFAGYMSEFVGIDGQALAPTEFGEFDADSGIWKPIDVSGLTFGTNGFYLDFKDSANLGNDASGGLDFTEVNITSADQATDTPTNNFATLNPLQATSYYTLKEGGTVLEPSQSGWGTGVSSIGVTSGKWYFEERSTATDRTTMYGIVNESDVLTLQGDKHVGDGVYSVAFYGNTGQVFSNGSVLATYNIFNQNQLVACALDLDNGKVYFAIQNTWQNSADPANGTGGISLPTGGSDTYFFGVNGYFSDNDVKTNHGGYTIQTPDSAASDENGYGTFEFAPPSGFYSICTKNLEEFG